MPSGIGVLKAKVLRIEYYKKLIVIIENPKKFGFSFIVQWKDCSRGSETVFDSYDLFLLDFVFSSISLPFIIPSST